MAFHNAVVTKGLMLLLGLGSLAAAIFDVKHYFHLQLIPHISKQHQYWRLLTHNLVFGSSSDLLLSQVVLFNVAINIERTFGSVKYASFLVVSTGLSTLLAFLSMLLLHRFGLNYVPPGPLGLLFSILYQHYRTVPPTYHFRISYLEVSNKAFMYFLAFQLMISHPPSTILTAIAGVITGQVYRSDLIGLKRWRISPRIVYFSSTYLRPLIGSTRPPRPSNQAFPPERRVDEVYQRDLSTAPTDAAAAQPGVTSGTDSRDNTAENASTTPQPSVMSQWVDELTGRRGAEGVRVPTEGEISTLVSVFPTVRREEIVATLQRSSNLQAAVDSLLQQTAQ